MLIYVCKWPSFKVVPYEWWWININWWFYIWLSDYRPIINGRFDQYFCAESYLFIYAFIHLLLYHFINFHWFLSVSLQHVCGWKILCNIYRGYSSNQNFERKIDKFVISIDEHRYITTCVCFKRFDPDKILGDLILTSTGLEIKLSSYLSPITLRPSQLCNGNRYTGKTVSLYWICPLAAQPGWTQSTYQERMGL